MEIETVTKGRAFPSRDREISRALWLAFEIVNAKWIRREQTIITNVPPGRMHRVLGMVKDGDANRVTFNRAVIVHPVGAFAPRVAITDAIAIYDVALTNFAFEPHG